MEGGDACALTLRPADWQNIELSPPSPLPPNTQHNKHRTAERRSDCGRCCGIPDHFRTTVSLSHQYYVAYRESGVIVKKALSSCQRFGAPEPQKNWFVRVSLSLYGSKAGAKATEPILIKFSPNLLATLGQNKCMKIFLTNKKINLYFGLKSLLFSKDVPFIYENQGLRSHLNA